MEPWKATGSLLFHCAPLGTNKGPGHKPRAGTSRAGPLAVGVGRAALLLLPQVASGGPPRCVSATCWRSSALRPCVGRGGAGSGAGRGGATAQAGLAQRVARFRDADAVPSSQSKGLGSRLAFTHPHKRLPNQGRGGRARQADFWGLRGTGKAAGSEQPELHGGPPGGDGQAGARADLSGQVQGTPHWGCSRDGGLGLEAGGWVPVALKISSFHRLHWRHLQPPAPGCGPVAP